MKSIFPSLALAIILAACCKDDTPNPNDNVPGLQPATQSGTNTLGFLLNGVPWIPNGINGLTIDYDPGFNQGIVGIAASRYISQSNRSSFGMGIADSLNFLAAPFTRQLAKTSIYRVGYSNIISCDLASHYDSVWSAGSITVSKLDRTARVIAGTFEATLYRNGCDTIKITKGRFDMKF